MSNFRFKSFDNSKQNILLCDIDECYMIKKLKQTLAEIKEIINEFAKEDILTFPDFSKEQNYKLIQKQCGEPILKILQKINEVEDEKNRQ